MAVVFTYTLDTNDLFDAFVDANDVTREWEEFICDMADDAARHEPRSPFTAFENFAWTNGYMDKAADIIEEAMRVYMNKRIDETGAGFGYC